MQGFARLTCVTIAALAVAGAGAACAQSRTDSDLDSLIGPQTVHGLADIRLAAADGERSWLDGGFGKTAVAAGHGRFDLSQAVAEWRPQLNFALGAVVSVQAQPQVRPALDLDEAYVTLKAPPTSVGRFSARAGLFYPPVSQEHTGLGWTTPDTVSASALDTWIGEEVKVGGVELSWKGAVGGHKLEATGAVFGWDDTSATLLTFRGWATDAVRAGAFTHFSLPPLSAFAGQFQGDETYPARELDHRAGYYARLEWRPPAPVSFNLIRYDNAGNRTAVDADLQWAWATRFTDAGLRWQADTDTVVLAQALQGHTVMGHAIPGGRWFDMDFQAAYALVTHRFGEDAATFRLDGFRNHDRTFVALDNNNETGWAATAAWRKRLSPHANLILEAERISSKRPARALAGVQPDQDQTVAQSVLRLSF
ncbi:hypothetical protein [Phenylobacterium sp.]|uniref:hypothetical protein n=1 Tax=Phenylobacterium sp. TaxID=1871053 RepID=UPI002C76BA1C|nr:hypothetical protein [Phenylobacterium sp.]HLZ73952.1 hypothetical protein [Phenylobacterium sp.]